jgi:hypothetical protein
MPLMAKKKPKSDADNRPKPNRRGKPLHVWLDPALRDLLDALAARTRRSLTTEVTIALEAHLTAAGLWPPPAPSSTDTPSESG